MVRVLALATDADRRAYEYNVHGRHARTTRSPSAIIPDASGATYRGSIASAPPNH
jgi:hypothetical protein